MWMCQIFLSVHLNIHNTIIATLEVVSLTLHPTQSRRRSFLSMWTSLRRLIGPTLSINNTLQCRKEDSSTSYNMTLKSSTETTSSLMISELPGASKYRISQRVLTKHSALGEVWLERNGIYRALFRLLTCHIISWGMEREGRFLHNGARWTCLLFGLDCTRQIWREEEFDWKLLKLQLANWKLWLKLLIQRRMSIETPPAREHLPSHSHFFKVYLEKYCWILFRVSSLTINQELLRLQSDIFDDDDPESQLIGPFIFWQVSTANCLLGIKATQIHERSSLQLLLGWQSIELSYFHRMCFFSLSRFSPRTDSAAFCYD